ncbi:D-arabinono-1,4-lactone oxidase [uncultured Abyssibacter sp.]|uniref:D-arabinono-1,4-lactone oxidase n=1 Tax=uncultured Abyssibacter sp. TaxID=2320202 RepID=UPI0032B3041D
MKRRDFLVGGAAVAVTPLAGCDDYGAANMPQPPAPRTGPDGERLLPWQNWSGYQSSLPSQRVAPETETALAELLTSTQGTVRPVGSGHSFTPLVPTDDTIVSLRHFSGLIESDDQAMTAVVGAGTKLGRLGEPLHEAGQALINMPDIDAQTLAGSMATATHGTGAGLGALHTAATALRLVTPTGEIIDCSAEQNPDVFQAAQVSLGSLGVLTRVTLQNVPTVRMKRRVWVEDFASLVDRFDTLAAEHHSFEMYCVPHGDYGIAITIDPTDEPVQPRGPEQDNDAVMDLKKLRDLLSWFPSARRWLLNMAMQDYQPEEAVDVWYRIFPSSRAVRFNEMEYHLPREALLPTVMEVRKTLERKHPGVFFPMEIRVVKGDDAWLSPFQGHATSGSIAVHRYYEEDPLPLFRDVEPIYQPLGGRPHWGKMHTLGPETLAERYPRFNDFVAMQAKLDPQGRMLNGYLRELFGRG